MMCVRTQYFDSRVCVTWLKLFFLVSCTTWLSIEAVETIEAGGPQRGDWGLRQKCPGGSFVMGMSLKIEDEIDGDNTGMNGIRFYCTNPWMTNLTMIESEDGIFGDWQPPIYCPAFTFAYGLQLKKEKGAKGQGQVKDKLGAVNLKLFCGSRSPRITIEGRGVQGVRGSQWGEWVLEEKKCRKGKFICSLQARVEPPLSEGEDGEIDDSALNDVRVDCCELDLN